MENGSLRSLVATIDQSISRLSPEAGDELRGSFAELVKLLRLDPVPEVRVCPACKRIVRRAATRCGYCWTKLSPLAA